MHKLIKFSYPNRLSSQDDNDDQLKPNTERKQFELLETELKLLSRQIEDNRCV